MKKGKAKKVQVHRQSNQSHLSAQPQKKSAPSFERNFWKIEKKIDGWA